MAEGLQRRRVHAQPVQRQPDLILVQDPQHHPLARPRRQGRDTHVQRLAAQRQGDASVLRLALLGDVQPRHDLDARHQQRRHARVQAQRLAQHPVHPHPHQQARLIAFQMDVRGADARRLGDDAVDQADDRRVVRRVQQVRRRNVVHQTVEAHRQGQVVAVSRRQLLARIDFRQFAVEGGGAQRRRLQRTAQRAARLDQGQRVRPFTHPHRHHLPRRQQQDAVGLGEAIGQARIDDGDHRTPPDTGGNGRAATGATGAMTNGSPAAGAAGGWACI